mmetsp:Transcript_10693/g.14419  ORF Transcript_10693/g.14419 Transcript_10693/m.14419 type:complete len:100 (+) Transcript_10693:117-416(+)
MQAVRDLLFVKCSPPLFRVEEGGHFVQEYGEEIAMHAMEHLFEFKPSSRINTHWALLVPRSFCLIHVAMLINQPRVVQIEWAIHGVRIEHCGDVNLNIF